MPQLILIVPVLAALWQHNPFHGSPLPAQKAAAVLYLEFVKPYPETITLISTEVLKP